MELPEGKRFGFLRGEGEDPDRFFYPGSMSGLSASFDDLEVGDYVTFEPVTGEDGRLRAVTVFLMGKAGDAESAPPFVPE